MHLLQEHDVLYEEKRCFGAISKSLHSVAETKLHNTNNGPSLMLPALLLAEKTDDVEFREMFLLSNKKTRKIRLPEAYSKLCLSSKGLIATVGDDNVVKLLNPLSRETINLPSLDTFGLSLESMESVGWKSCIRKLLVSSVIPNLGIIVVVWGHSLKLGYCRPSDNEWTPVFSGWSSMIFDVTYYNDRVYCFDGKYYIRSCDIYGDNPTVMVMVSKLPRELYSCDGSDFGAYIIGCDDDDGRRRLLVIIKETTWDEDTSDEENTIYLTEGFKVFGYDLETGTWSKVNDLGRKSVFVGHNSSFWIEDATGVIKENCIYYTENGLACGRDMGIYHMSDATIEPHYDGESLSKLTPPIWLEKI
ncbi:putative F-box protein At5g55150 [Rutidosis leptorrhynchoides]|uniref:putative F-box protein At5g55150 n=1 Tax=Rutidosis leptorrhynchoides TaxID=125765 RepID=UPI003A9A5E5B